MAIVKMSKFHLYTFREDRKKVLNHLQKFKEVHFNNLETTEEDYISKVEIPSEVITLDEDIANAKYVIDILENFEEKKSALQELKDGNKSFTLSEIEKRAVEFDFEINYKKIKELDSEKSNYSQKIQNLSSKIEELLPWENLPLEVERLNSFKQLNVRSGTVSIKNFENFKNDLEDIDLSYIEEISRDKNLVYIIIVNDFSVGEDFNEILTKHNFTKLDIKAAKEVRERIKEYKEEIESAKREIEKIDNKLKDKCSYLEDFKIYYEYLRNQRLKLETSGNFAKTRKLDLIEGYVPSVKLKDFEKSISENIPAYYMESLDADKEDLNVPIKLKNNAFVKPFESLTEMYSMPRYGEIDPTPLFAPFYFIFAGIMVGDFGYGCLVVLATLIALKKFNLDEVKKRFFKFGMYLGISTMVWGIFFGTFFGDLIPLKAVIDPATDYYEMIGLSLALGAFQIFFSLGIKAYMEIRDHKPLDALYDVGFWYMAIIGSLVAIAAGFLGLSNSAKNIALIVMGAGMIGIVATGGREEKTTGGRIGWGIYALYGITSYYGDFISYFRLMALALAGSFISIAVNIIVRMLFGLGLLGMIAGGFIFIVFQLFNLFLSYLSAYVHSARLTYVEMFNKFYEGGGVAFRDMVAKSQYFNIKEEK